MQLNNYAEAWPHNCLGCSRTIVLNWFIRGQFLLTTTMISSANDLVDLSGLAGISDLYMNCVKTAQYPAQRLSVPVAGTWKQRSIRSKQQNLSANPVVLQDTTYNDCIN